MGFRGVFLDWVRSFLSDRKAFVILNEVSSDEYTNNMGVAQGSVLGPLLFLLFINDLPAYVVGCIIVMFADDTSIAIRAKSWHELKLLCETIVECFTDWCHRNALILNLTKSIIVRFQNQDNSYIEPLIIKHKQGELKAAGDVKFLGLYVDGNLRWHLHIEHVCGRLSSAYYAMLRLRNSLPIEELLTIYYSMVYSHLSYNVVLWGSSGECKRLFISQKRIIRLIFKLRPCDSCRPIFSQFRVLPFPCIFILNCLTYIHTNISKYKKCSDFHGYGTRHTDTIALPRHRTAKYESSPRYIGIKLYNHLPSRLKSMNGRSFKREVKSMLINGCYYSVEEFLKGSISEV